MTINSPLILAPVLDNNLLSELNYDSLIDFPDSFAGKESTCNKGDLGLIPGSGRSPGEGICYPLQYSWASLVAQTVKNLPAMKKTQVQFLAWEDPLEKGWTSHSNILGLPWWLRQ